MGRKETRAYILAVRPRYVRANRAEKGVIIGEMAATLGVHRKSVIRMLHRRFSTSRQSLGRGRPSRLQMQDRVILGRLFELCQYPCGKRFVSMLPIWADYDEQLEGPYAPGQKERLLSLSSASLDRLTAPMRKAAGIKGKSGTKPGSLLREHIPIRSGPWDVQTAGFLEADTVAHCGHSMQGEFAWSLTLTDIHTGWTECRAVWNKGKKAIVEAMQDIDAALPFTLKAIDSDNGSEFLNKTLIQYFQEHPDKPSFTRSRPYKKNDQAHVEQKIWTHVRQLLGYMRIERKVLIDDLNDLYRNHTSFMNNFFTPSMKLISKERIGSKIVKRYDKAQTPLQRLLADTSLHPDIKDQLQAQARSINPIMLRHQIKAKIHDIYKKLR